MRNCGGQVGGKRNKAEEERGGGGGRSKVTVYGNGSGVNGIWMEMGFSFI